MALGPISRLRVPLFAALAVALAAALAPAEDKPKAAADEGYVQLFNGKDLTGWKLHGNPNPGQLSKIIAIKEGDRLIGYDGEQKDKKVVHLWRVEDGVLIGSGPSTHLFSEKADYADFSYRVEAKINDKGNSGQYFRTKFEGGFPTGYEAQINATHSDKIRTGSLYPDGRLKLGEHRKEITVMDTAAHKADEFFTQEVIATGKHIRILVNGKQTVDFTDPNPAAPLKGHFALQGHDPGTVVTFKKIEYKPITK